MTVSEETAPATAAADGGPQNDGTQNNSTQNDVQDDIQDDIQQLRLEIDRLDSEILRLVKRRTEVSQRIGRARMAAGGPRIVYSREMAVLARFRELGSEGRDLALLLLRLGRGRLGAGTPR